MLRQVPLSSQVAKARAGATPGTEARDMWPVGLGWEPDCTTCLCPGILKLPLPGKAREVPPLVEFLQSRGPGTQLLNSKLGSSPGRVLPAHWTLGPPGSRRTK
jgi:hypothetical protein